MTRKRDALKILLQNTGGILPKFYRKIHCLTSEFHINLTQKSDIARITKRSVRYRFFKWNLTCNSLVRQWIFLESHSENHLGETKRFLFLWAAPVRKLMETLSISQGRCVSFSVNSFISKVFFFPSMSWIFIFTIQYFNFARDSRQQYPFMHKCNFSLNTLSLIANQDANLAFSYAILKEISSSISEFNPRVRTKWFTENLRPKAEICHFPV